MEQLIIVANAGTLIERLGGLLALPPEIESYEPGGVGDAQTGPAGAPAS